MVLNAAGVLLETIWKQIPEFYHSVDIDMFQIMPNHIHGIVVIKYNDSPVGANPCVCPLKVAGYCI
jgi:REP element-mobilizing transposase RayT